MSEMLQSVIVEIRPRLQACNVFIMTTKCFNDFQAVDVKVIHPSTVSLRWRTNENADSFKSICFTVNECKLLPDSISGLQVYGNSISFRIQTNPVSNMSGSFSSEVLVYKKTEHFPEKSAPDISVNEPYHFVCRCCNNTVCQSETGFDRVLPLPSASWEIEDLFCHRHSGASDIEKEFKLKENYKDCLYGSCYICIPKSALNQCLLSSDKALRCNRCLSWLGTHHTRGVKLWSCSVMYDITKQASTPLQDFLCILKEAIQESVGMLCRLLIETYISEKETHYILLWVMDKDLQLLVNLCNAEVKENALEQEYSFKLKSTKSIKVLYLYSQSYTPTVKLWHDDVNVQTIDVAKQMFTEGLGHLVKVTEAIPAPNRTANGFFVSYLGVL